MSLENVVYLLAGWVVAGLLVTAFLAYVKRNDPPN